jgi:hypothetical protein
MEIRVVAPDAESARHLVQHLAGAFDPGSLRLDADSRTVGVYTERAGSRTLVHVLGAVEEWLDDAPVAAVTVVLDGRSHTLARRCDWPVGRAEALQAGGRRSDARQ